MALKYIEVIFPNLFEIWKASFFQRILMLHWLWYWFELDVKYILNINLIIHYCYGKYSQIFEIWILWSNKSHPIISESVNKHNNNNRPINPKNNGYGTVKFYGLDFFCLLLSLRLSSSFTLFMSWFSQTVRISLLHSSSAKVFHRSNTWPHFRAFLHVSLKLR